MKDPKKSVVYTDKVMYRCTDGGVDRPLDPRCRYESAHVDWMIKCMEKALDADPSKIDPYASETSAYGYEYETFVVPLSRIPYAVGIPNRILDLVERFCVDRFEIFREYYHHLVKESGNDAIFRLNLRLKVQEFDLQFVHNKTVTLLVQLMDAAIELQIESLLDLTRNAIGEKIDRMSPKQILKIFNLPDLTHQVWNEPLSRLNNEVQFAGEIQPRGSLYRVEFSSGDQKMLNRQVVNSETATIKVMTFPSTCGACAVSCETRMYLTKIPYFQEVIVMASTCDACGYRNSELKAGGAIPAKGKKVSVSVKDVRDLSRDVIKSDTASVIIPEIDLELTSGTLGGIVTTVEGLVIKISEALERVHGFTFGDSLEEGRKDKWQDFRARLIKILSLEEPWTLIMDDALANSFIAPACDDIKDDQQLTIEEYERSWEQNEELGLNDMDTSTADAAYNAIDSS